MRKLIGRSGENERNESWYYVEFDESDSCLYYVHEWNNLSYAGAMDKGEERMLLHTAKSKLFYTKAVAALQTVFE